MFRGLDRHHGRPFGLEDLGVGGFNFQRRVEGRQSLVVLLQERLDLALANVSLHTQTTTQEMIERR
jgi:hypothetical protein